MALVCLFLAGLALMRGQGFARCIVFALIFLCLRSLIVLVSGWAGASAVMSLIEPREAFAGAGFLSRFVEQLDQEFTNLRLARHVAPIVAGFFIVKAIWNAQEGYSPVRPLLAATFLLSIVGTRALLIEMSGGSGSAQATRPDTFFTALGSLFNYTANRICPAAAGFAIIAAIISYSQRKSWMHYVFTSVGCLTVSGLLVLLRRFVTTPI
jgi:hypothetical protein